MKRRSASLVAAGCSALMLVLGTNTAVATTLDQPVAAEAQSSDGDGAPQGLTVIGEWTISTTDAKGRTIKVGVLPGDEPAATKSSSAVAASGSWWDGQCGSNAGTKDKMKTIKQYNRPNDHSRMKGGRAKMYCGRKDKTKSENAFELRHVRDRHKSDFGKLAALEGRDWGNFMHWSVSWTIREPSRRTVQNANRYCYQKRFDFRGPSGSGFSRQVVVILGRTGIKIMTAWPSTNTSYCKGLRL